MTYIISLKSVVFLFEIPIHITSVVVGSRIINYCLLAEIFTYERTRTIIIIMSKLELFCFLYRKNLEIYT